MKDKAKVIADLNLVVIGENLDEFISTESIQDIKLEVKTDSGITYRVKVIGHEFIA